MACFHPLLAWRGDDGKIAFRENGGRRLYLPCGKCIGCREVKTRSWALRCVHEAQMHEVNSFVTLTYDDEHYSPSLNYGDYQKFMYRLRRQIGPTRFFMCGEYGEVSLRPHFHALLFGRTFTDGVPCGKDIFSSRTLSKLWPMGFSSFGGVTYESASYVARYTCKKVTGDRADRHYSRVDRRTGEVVRVVPEFAHMSLGRRNSGGDGGIGYSWFQKYWKEVYVARDGVVRPGGRVVPAPRYYDDLLRLIDPVLREEKDYDRYLRSEKFLEDCTEARLSVRERCALAKAKFLRRTL